MIRFAADEDLDNHIVRGLRHRLPDIDFVRVQEAGISGAVLATLAIRHGIAQEFPLSRRARRCLTPVTSGRVGRQAASHGRCARPWRQPRGVTRIPNDLGPDERSSQHRVLQVVLRQVEYHLVPGCRLSCAFRAGDLADPTPPLAGAPPRPALCTRPAMTLRLRSAFDQVDEAACVEVDVMHAQPILPEWRAAVGLCLPSSANQPAGRR